MSINAINPKMIIAGNSIKAYIFKYKPASKKIAEDDANPQKVIGFILSERRFSITATVVLYLLPFQQLMPLIYQKI
jgi:uncharacterized membrane protein